MKIDIGIPAYDGKIHVETARSLWNEQGVAGGCGVDLQVKFLPGVSLITLARNQLAQEFMDGDADVLVFIDSDVSWEPGDLIRLASHPVDLVGGAYRYKSQDENYPVGWLGTPELWAVNGLLEVARMPAGFLACKRSAFEKMKDAYPERGYEHMGAKAHAYFTAPFRDGSLFGEDAAFCEDFRAIGGKVYLDPELTLTHTGGNQSFTGHIGKWLKSR